MLFPVSMPDMILWLGAVTLSGGFACSLCNLKSRNNIDGIMVSQLMHEPGQLCVKRDLTVQAVTHGNKFSCRDHDLM